MWDLRPKQPPSPDPIWPVRGDWRPDTQPQLVLHWLLPHVGDTTSSCFTLQGHTAVHGGRPEQCAPQAEKTRVQEGLERTPCVTLGEHL